VQIIRTEKQKDNLAKYAWDMSKIVVAALAIAPFARPEAVDVRVVGGGLLAGLLLALGGYLLDGMEIKL
jgi:hypothetical protein